MIISHQHINELTDLVNLFSNFSHEYQLNISKKYISNSLIFEFFNSLTKDNYKLQLHHKITKKFILLFDRLLQRVLEKIEFFSDKISISKRFIDDPVYVLEAPKYNDEYLLVDRIAFLKYSEENKIIKNEKIYTPCPRTHGLIEHPIKFKTAIIWKKKRDGFVLWFQENFKRILKPFWKYYNESDIIVEVVPIVNKVIVLFKQLEGINRMNFSLRKIQEVMYKKFEKHNKGKREFVVGLVESKFGLSNEYKKRKEFMKAIDVLLKNKELLKVVNESEIHDDSKKKDYCIKIYRQVIDIYYHDLKKKKPAFEHLLKDVIPLIRPLKDLAKENPRRYNKSVGKYVKILKYYSNNYFSDSPRLPILLARVVNSNKEASDWFTKGARLLINRKYDDNKVLKSLTEAVTRNPANIQALKLLKGVHLRLKNFDSIVDVSITLADLEENSTKKKKILGETLKYNKKDKRVIKRLCDEYAKTRNVRMIMEYTEVDDIEIIGHMRGKYLLNMIEFYQNNIKSIKEGLIFGIDDLNSLAQSDRNIISKSKKIKEKSEDDFQEKKPKPISPSKEEIQPKETHHSEQIEQITQKDDTDDDDDDLFFRDAK